MKDKIITIIQEAFAEIYNLNDLAWLYFDIRMECEKQLEYMSVHIAKEMKENGVLDDLKE
jgi:hypothetical protein